MAARTVSTSWLRTAAFKGSFRGRVAPVPREFTRRGRQPFQPQTVLLARKGLPRGLIDSGEARHEEGMSGFRRSVA
jgi:hypothetical protein